MIIYNANSGYHKSIALGIVLAGIGEFVISSIMRE
jgi:hypothetical protein